MYHSQEKYPLFLNNASHSFPKEEAKILAQKLHSLLNNNRIGQATECLIRGISLGCNDFLRLLRREGVLRASRYRWHEKGLITLIDNVTQQNSIITPEGLDYLHSVRALCTACADTRRLNREIRGILKSGGAGLLRKLLAELNHYFLQRTIKEFSFEGNPDSRHVDFWGREELAEAYSYVYTLARTDALTCHPKTKEKVCYLDELITKACLVKSYLDFEFMVDAMGYSAVEMSARDIRIIPPNKDIKKAFSIGNAKHRMKDAARSTYFPDATSLMKIGQVLCDAFQHEDIRLVNGLLPKYTATIRLPLELASQLSSSALFREELIEVHRIAEDLLVTPEVVLEYKITEEITIFDLLKANRFFVLCWGYLLHFSLPRLETERERITNSLVLDRTKNELIDLFRYATGEKAERIFNFLTTPPSQSNKFDLQSQPIIACIDGVYSVPLNIILCSDTIRNTLSFAQKRLLENSSCDPMAEEIEKELLRSYG